MTNCFVHHAPAGPWQVRTAGDRQGLALFERHYSCRPLRSGRVRTQFAGPGEKLVLVTARGDAMLVWLKQRYRMDRQNGVCCAVFRNEGRCLSSALVRSGMNLAWRRWPGERLFTYVDAGRVRSRNPGYCFLRAGWRRCGRSKGGLLLLEVPEAEPLGGNPDRVPSHVEAPPFPQAQPSTSTHAPA